MEIFWVPAGKHRGKNLFDFKPASSRIRLAVLLMLLGHG